jgi:putative endonuclease
MTMARRRKPENPPAAPRPERVAAHFTGLSAESRAAAYLVAKGYRIVARRFKTPVGEVDIVARRRDVLVFIEVKARNTLDDAAFAVLPRQQQRIAAAAGAWLASHPEDAESAIRFDAILVAPRSIPRHIAAAFEAE